MIHDDILTQNINLIVDGLGGKEKTAKLVKKSRKLIYLWCDGTHEPDYANMRLLCDLYEESRKKE